jgi:NAD(P)H dehydrogenase (quinone)
MNALVIVAHPNSASFNHAIAQTCARALTDNGHEVIAHDLYKERFDPVLPHDEFQKDAALPAEIERHCDEVSQADGIVIIHPNWWGQPPAILKGWADRVIRPGVAYEFLEGDKGEGVPRGLLKAKCAIIFNTSNTETTREKTVFGDPLEAIWKNCVFNLCGVPVVHRKMFNVVVTSSAAERKEWLSEVAALTKRSFPREHKPALEPTRSGGS